MDILLSANADVNKPNCYGFTALHLEALTTGKPAAVKTLLDAKADPTLKDYSGGTALKHALASGNTEALTPPRSRCPQRDRIEGGSNTDQHAR